MCETNTGGYSKEHHAIHPDPQIKITKYIFYKNVSGSNFSLIRQRQNHV